MERHHPHIVRNHLTFLGFLVASGYRKTVRKNPKKETDRKRNRRKRIKNKEPEEEEEKEQKQEEEQEVLVHTVGNWESFLKGSMESTLYSFCERSGGCDSASGGGVNFKVEVLR